MARSDKERGPVVLLEATGEPAFASDDDHNIVAWNTALERLLGRPAASVIGSKCWQAFGGRDVFGNPYCHQFCGARQAILRNEPVRRFDLDVCKESGEVVRVSCSTLLVSSNTKARPTVVHLLQPVTACGAAEDDGECCSAACDDAGAVPEALPGQSAVVTRRQLEILRYLAEGWTNQAVAEVLGISVSTVRTHANNILRKFAVHSIRQAVARARHSGLL